MSYGALSEQTSDPLLEKDWLRRLGSATQKCQDTNRECADTESGCVSEANTEKLEPGGSHRHIQTRADLTSGIQKDDGSEAMRYETQVACSLTTSSVDIRSLKRRLLATLDAQRNIPTKKQKGCGLSATSSSSSSHSREDF